MAVVNTTPTSTPPPATTVSHSESRRTETRPEGEKSRGIGGWVKKHKAVTALGGAGVLVLVFSHKGSQSTSGTSAADQAAAAAAEQAAIDQAVAGAGLNPPDNSGSSGGDTFPSDGTGSGGGNAGGGDAPGSSPPTPPVTININEPSPLSPEKKGGTKGTNTPSGGGGGSSHKGKSLGNPPPGHGHVSDPFKHKPPKTTNKGKKPHPSHPEKPTTPRRKTRGSVMKHGRAFPRAISVHVGAGFTTSDGVMHEPVTVNYGGYSETHMSHNCGEAWTDNVPGYTPPSRGMPERRLGTPPLVGADWEEVPTAGHTDIETRGLMK